MTPFLQAPSPLCSNFVSRRVSTNVPLAEFHQRLSPAPDDARRKASYNSLTSGVVLSRSEALMKLRERHVAD